MPTTVDTRRAPPAPRQRGGPDVGTGAAPRVAVPPLAAGVRAGAGDMLPIAVAMLPFAVVLGVAVDASVVADATALLFAPLLYAGAAQFAVLSILDAAGSAVTAVVAALIVNARFTMYGAAMAWRFRRQPAWFRWLAPWLIVDQTFALAAAREETEPAWFRGYWLSSGLVLAVAFVTAMLAGVVLGPVLPPGIGLAFTIPALFLALLVGQLRDRPAVVAAVTGGLVTALGLELPHGLGMLAGALAGAVAGLIARRTS